MGFLKKKSLRVIVDAPRDSGISNSFDFRLTNIQSMPINESGLLAKFFIAAKFDHTSPSGWPVLQIRRRIFTNDASYLSQPFSTTMEPRPTGYLNVFEYDVRNMAFDFQHSDLIRVFWPQDTNVISRRYSLAYFRDTSNVMLSIEIGQTASTTPDDSISTPVPQTTTSVIEITTTTKKPTPELKEGTTTMNNGITRSGGVLDMVTSSVISTQREQFGHVTATNNTIIIIGSLACTMLVLMLLTVVSVTTVLTYRWHKHKTATQQASSDFDMDSNQAYTTRKESKHDETVDMCIEMDANQAYVTHSKANIKGQQEQDQGATGTTECIEMDANQAYVTPSETNKGLQEQGQGATGTMEMDANQAYGTNTVLSDPSVTYDNNYPPQANDYDYIALS